ncbi:RDD family protein [Micromonospora eburnea]|uniref:RDD family protein n=1 Tax=Micromonospora eburnea TaxID=227316 RepID=A0A1C6VLV2_9ACTN|nr:RDD family protein [Micromonospora eburnea]SCL67306.1 RDD family protein [Micromonospora eburnea]
MTQPPPNAFPPPAGPPPAGGGFVPPTGPPYAPPAQYAPPAYAGPPGYPPPMHPPYPGFVPPALAPNGQPLASFADRLLAWLIDTAVATLLGMVLFLPVFIWLWFRMFREMTTVNPDGTAYQPDPATMMTDFFLPILLAEAGLVVVMLVFYWLYHVEYARRTGQTLGKKAMKIRIIPVDPSAPLTRGALGKRYLVEFVAGSLVPFANYVDGFWQLWDKPWQQCLHDKFAGTVVVKVAP